MARDGFLKKEVLSNEMLAKIVALNNVAANRGQSLAEMALAWLLKDELVTSVLVGASSVAQLDKNLKAVKNTTFDAEELMQIAEILK